MIDEDCKGGESRRWDEDIGKGEEGREEGREEGMGRGKIRKEPKIDLKNRKSIV